MSGGGAVQENNYDWAEDMLEAAHLPVGLNLCNVLRWMAAENPPAHWWRNWNPLNVADFTGPTHSFPGWFEGALATADVLRQSNMKGIVVALLNHQGDADYFSAALHDSPWSASHYYSATYVASIPVPPVIVAA
jgi:hypothetical protein